MKGVHPQPCCGVVGESLAQVVPKPSYFHLWSCLEIQSSQADEGSSEELGSHSGFLGWPPGISFCVAHLAPALVCQGGLCVPCGSGSLHKGHRDFSMPLLCWRLDLFQIIALVNFLLWCYTAVVWSKIKSCLCTSLQCHLFLSLMESWFICTGLTCWPK